MAVRRRIFGSLGRRGEREEEGGHAWKTLKMGFVPSTTGTQIVYGLIVLKMSHTQEVIYDDIAACRRFRIPAIVLDLFVMYMLLE